MQKGDLFPCLTWGVNSTSVTLPHTVTSFLLPVLIPWLPPPLPPDPPLPPPGMKCSCSMVFCLFAANAILLSLWPPSVPVPMTTPAPGISPAQPMPPLMWPVIGVFLSCSLPDVGWEFILIMWCRSREGVAQTFCWDWAFCWRGSVGTFPPCVGVWIHNTHTTNPHPVFLVVWWHEQPLLSILSLLPVLGLASEGLCVRVLIGGNHGFVVLVLLVLGQSGQSPCVTRDVTHVEQLITGLHFSWFGQSIVVGVDVLWFRGIQGVRIGGRWGRHSRWRRWDPWASCVPGEGSSST